MILLTALFAHSIATNLTTLQLSEGCEWLYPFDMQYVKLPDLSAVNVIAIVKPLAQTQLPTPRNRWTRSNAPIEQRDFYVDRFQVISCAIGDLRGTVAAVYPKPTLLRGRSVPPPPQLDTNATYLLLARSEDEGKLREHYFDRSSPPEFPLNWSLVERLNPSELSGVALFRTSMPEIRVREDRTAMILIAIVDAINQASDDDVRRICRFLNRLRISWSPPNIEGLSAEKWRTSILGEEMRSASLTLTSYGRANVLGLLAEWGVPNTAGQWLDALEDAFLAGSNLRQYGQTLLPQRGSGAGILTSDRLCESLEIILDDHVRDWLIRMMVGKPSREGLLQLRELLEVESLRYVIFSNFATWANRPDLEPRWDYSVFPPRIEREAELLAYWRSRLP
jgi:hypothetical protein